MRNIYQIIMKYFIRDTDICTDVKVYREATGLPKAKQYFSKCVFENHTVDNVIIELWQNPENHYRHDYLHDSKTLFEVKAKPVLIKQHSNLPKNQTIDHVSKQLY